MLDEKDKVIFEHLIHDCRTTTTYLSKVTHLTQPTVVYRIRNLEKEGYISKYDVILNWNKFPIKLDLYLISVPENKINKFEQYCDDNKFIFGVVKLIHKRNYLVWTFASKEEEKQFQLDLKKKDIEYDYHPHFKIDFLPYSIYEDVKIKTQFQPIKNNNQTLKLDKNDLKILEILSDGGAKLSMLEIAKRTGISIDIVTYRYKKLKKTDYIAMFVAQPSIAKFHLQSDFLILETKNIDFQEVINKLKTINKIPYVIYSDKNKMLFQLFSKSFDEYKANLKRIYKVIGENLEKLEAYNTDGWLFVNRINFEKLVNC